MKEINESIDEYRKTGIASKILVRYLIKNYDEILFFIEHDEYVLRKCIVHYLSQMYSNRNSDITYIKSAMISSMLLSKNYLRNQYNGEKYNHDIRKLMKSPFKYKIFMEFESEPAITLKKTIVGKLEDNYYYFFTNNKNDATLIKLSF